MMRRGLLTRSVLGWSLALGLAGLGCSVNTNPQVPSWDSQINVPLVNQVHTMQDLVGNDAFVLTGGDAGVLGFRVEGDTVRATVGNQLSIAGFTGNFRDSLGDFFIRDPGGEQSSYDLATLWPPSVGLDGATAPVPIFTFTSQAADLPDLATFTSVTLSSGSLDVTVTNQLPVPITVTTLEIVDRNTSQAVATLGFGAEIAAGATDTESLPLAGVSLSNRLEIRATGKSPGSSGAPVLINKNARVDVTAVLSGLKASAATAQIPSTGVDFSDPLDLPRDMQVRQATLASGTLNLSIINEAALGSRLVITIPELTAPGGGPLSLVTDIAPSGATSRELDLAGYTLAPGAPDISGLQHLAVNVSAETQDTGSQSVTVSAGDRVNVDASISSLSLAQVEGVLSATTVDVPTDTTTVSLPEGLQSISLAQASLDLVITTPIQFPMSLDLTAHGHGRDGLTHDLPVQGSFPAGPGAGERELHLVLTEQNSQIVPFLNSLPDRIVFGGHVTLGDGVASATVASSDSIRARFLVSTPLKLTMQPQTIKPSPDRLLTIEGTDGSSGDRQGETKLSPDVTKHLLEGSVRVQVTNHLPFGMQMRVKLATDSAKVASSPDVVVGPFTVNPGVIDAATGLVSTSVVSSNDLALSAQDLEIFKNPSGPAKRVWGGVELIIAGTGGTAVAVRASDYVEISALAHLGVNVDLAKGH